MSKPSLVERFAALQAEREQSWSPEQLAGNAQQRTRLVQHYDPANHAAAGDRLAPFTLIDTDSAPFTSAQLLNKGPAVIIIYRFGACPACNIALLYYNEMLWPALAAGGIQLIAVSPQLPVDRGPIDRHGLRFPLYGDPDYTLERALGITFLPEEQPAITPGQGWIGATLGTNSYELPQPAIVILGTDHRIRDIIVSPDWLARPEADVILTRSLVVSAQQLA
jgi:peroxiredoxin